MNDLNINALASHVASSKTLLFWLALVMIALILIIFSLLILVIFGVQNPYVKDILTFMGVAGGGGTARNVISDGIMPRIPQAFAATKDPQIAVQSPMPMVNINQPAQQGVPYTPIPGPKYE